ncbi:PucR family transcriptional regulator ligand-binding domain-containing protein [Nocardioides sp.]|uniref:PucR family transcriptional regulator n=1 Tax=Nocardioides sp. TaxID=35761 RepID=UPI003528E81F
MKRLSSATMASPDAELVPLRWLVERADLALVPHHLPDPGLAVGWAHAIELDDPAPWLPAPHRAGPGLVLTTGLRLPRTKQGQEAYVARLHEAGVGALGVGTGLRFAAMPFAVAAACRDRGLPLLEVPLETPFLAVVRAVADRVAELRAERLRASVRAQQRLTRAAVRRGAAGVCAELARAVGVATLALTRDGLVLARAGAPAVPVAEVLEAVAAEGAPGPVVVSDAARTLEVQPLGPAPREVTAWLAVARATPLDPTERLVVSHAVGVLTLEVEQSGRPDDTLRERILDQLLSGRTSDPADLARAAGLDPDDLLVLTGLRVDDDAVARRVVSAAVRTQALLAAPEPGGHSAWLLLTSPAGARALAASLPEVASAVLSPPVSLAALPTMVPLVRRALAAAPPGSVVPLATDPAALVAADPTVLSVVDPWLTALREYDAAHGADLVPSLAAYLRHHAVWDPAAQAVGVHRHTLRHRVGRAADIAGFDLDDPRHRALLTLALTTPT